MELWNLQERFQASLVLRPSDPILYHQFQEPLKGTLQKRFGIYQNNVQVRLMKTLKNTYEVCVKLLGEKCFEGLAREYVKTNVSTSRSLNDYGFHFPLYIRSFQDRNGDRPLQDQVPYLSDVATLEWAVHQAWIGRDSHEFPFNTFSCIPEDKLNQIVFKLSENLTLIHSPFPIDKIWETNQPDYCGETIVNLQDGEVFLIVFQKERQLRIDKVSKSLWQLLDAIKKGCTIEELCKTSINPIVDTLPQCIAAGYITDFTA